MAGRAPTFAELMQGLRPARPNIVARQTGTHEGNIYDVEDEGEVSGYDAESIRRGFPEGGAALADFDALAERAKAKPAGLPLADIKATLEKAAGLPQFSHLPRLTKAAPVATLPRETLGAPGGNGHDVQMLPVQELARKPMPGTAPQFAGGPTSPAGVLSDAMRGAGTSPSAPAPDGDETANRGTLHARLGRAGAMAGAAISGTKADTDYWDELAKEPQTRLAQMKALLAKKAELDAKQKAAADGMAFDREKFGETVRHNKATEARPAGGGLSASLAYRMGRDQVEDRRRLGERADAKQASIDTEQRKKVAGMADVEERARNIDSSLAQLEELVGKRGTYEMFGPENEQLEALVTSYATDMAKLRDPTSVAREGEVALEKKAMFEPGTWKVSNATALQLVKDARKRAAQRRAEAYRVRGLEAPADGGGPTPAVNDSAAGGPPAQAPEAGGMVTILDPSGKPVKVSAGRVEAALAAGGRMP